MLYALPDHRPLRRLGELPLRYPVLLHDFIVTGRHLVFFVAPLKILFWRLTLALRPFTVNFRWVPTDGTEVIVVPVDQPDRPVRFLTAAFNQFHFAGAFKYGDEIVIDYVRPPEDQGASGAGNLDDFSWADLKSTAHGTLHRARINIPWQQLRSVPLWDGSGEFTCLCPTLAGRRHESIWIHSHRLIDGVLPFGISGVTEAGEASLYRCELGAICSEPVFAAGIPRFTSIA